MPRKKDPPQPAMIPKWVPTFADMISLLVTFFILLMTYSSQDSEMYAKMMGSMTGAFGVVADPSIRDYRAIQKPPPTVQNRTPNDGIRSSQTDLVRLEETATILVRKRNLGTKVQVQSNNDRVRIRLVAEVGFSAGSHRLTDETRRLLREISDFLRLHRRDCVVVAHAANEGAADPQALSESRALSAARYLHEVARVPRERLLIAARGDQFPLDRNQGPESDIRNRRLEIWILPQSDGE